MRRVEEVPTDVLVPSLKVDECCAVFVAHADHAGGVPEEGIEGGENGVWHKKGIKRTS